MIYEFTKEVLLLVKFAELETLDPENKGTSRRKDRKDKNVSDLYNPYDSSKNQA